MNQSPFSFFSPSRTNTTNNNFRQNVAGPGGVVYDTAGGDVIDGGAFALVGRTLEEVFALHRLGQERAEREVTNSQEFARTLGQDFLAINLQSTRTEAAQRAADRNEIIRLSLPFLAVGVIGYAFIAGRK